jgi:hypothetical protein
VILFDIDGLAEPVLRRAIDEGYAVLRVLFAVVAPLMLWRLVAVARRMPQWGLGWMLGCLCMAVVFGDPDSGGVVDSLTVQLPGRRRQVREFTVITLLGLLRRRLLEKDATGQDATDQDGT